MRIPRIYHSEPLSEGRTIKLSLSASRHVATVLRLKEGASIILFDGNGGEYAAEIASIKKGAVEVNVSEHCSVSKEPSLQIHLGQGISRGDKMDFTLQKAVECGVTEITPLFTERCGVKLSGERLQKRMAHWQQVVISACEQSGRCIIPSLHDPVSLSDWRCEDDELGVVFGLDATASLKMLKKPSGPIKILIGPEGGLSDAEIELANCHGFTPCTLGPRVLRTETAGIVAITTLQTLWG